nr:meiotic nuclear division protein 1 homolog isoform X2 [Pongo pygmaeus]
MSVSSSLKEDDNSTQLTVLKDVFQLKDLEKIAPKEKGITAMSVKEVLQSLVDDGMVDCERIGTSNYYWAFPSKALHARKHKLEVLESQVTFLHPHMKCKMELSEGSQKHASLQKSIEKAKIGRCETEERTRLAKELSSLRDQREQLKAEVEKYKDCDPQVMEEIQTGSCYTGLELLGSSSPPASASQSARNPGVSYCTRLKDNIIKELLPKLIYRFNAKPIKISAAFLQKLAKQIK